MKTIYALQVTAAALAMAASAPSGAQSITLKGSDTLLPLAQAWAQAYAKVKPGVAVTVTGGGSTTGLAALVNGGCDIANASRSIKGSEIDKAKARGFVPREYPVARDGLAIIVNASNPLRKITIDQLRDIYSGKATTWKALGGSQRPITAVGRESSSGTYGFFQDTVLGVGRPYRPDMLSSVSNNAIVQTVAQDEGAIGYVGIAYAKGAGAKVRILLVAKGNGEAIEPTQANVLSGKYPLSRYLFMYTHGPATGATKEFIDWVRSAKGGQTLVDAVGYFTL